MALVVDGKVKIQSMFCAPVCLLLHIERLGLVSLTRVLSAKSDTCFGDTERLIDSNSGDWV